MQPRSACICIQSAHDVCCSFGESLNIVESRNGNFRINPDFRIENFYFKHEMSLLHLFKGPSFCVKSSYLDLYMPEVTLKTNY